MSIRRLVVTAGAMGVIALVLCALTPGLADMARAVAHAQWTADTLGPDEVVVAAAGLGAWAVWAWGVLGLALTAASAAPGLVGAAARVVTRSLLPAGARRAAAVALGLGLGIAAPLVGPAVTPMPLIASAAPLPAATTGAPDWPAAADRTAPDWPTAPAPTIPAPARTAPARTASVPDWLPEAPAEAHVVVRGDCLWHIAAAWLLAHQGRPPTDAETATAVHAWWTANASVIGPDPDLLLPGQVLLPPGAP
jgi:hypothetical protein